MSSFFSPSLPITLSRSSPLVKITTHHFRHMLCNVRHTLDDCIWSCHCSFSASALYQSHCSMCDFLHNSTVSALILMVDRQKLQSHLGQHQSIGSLSYGYLSHIHKQYIKCFPLYCVCASPKLDKNLLCDSTTIMGLCSCCR